MNSSTHFKKSALHGAVALALGISGAALILNAGDAQANNQSCANGGSTDSGNFTMLTAGGYVVGGTNNASMTWDGTAFTDSSDYTGPGSTANVTMSSTTPFFGTTVAYTWTAHDIQVFAPGSYSFNTALGGGNGESGIMNVTVPAGQIGMHMLFNWNGNNNIDVFVVAKPSSVFGAGIGYTTQKTASGLFMCGTGASGTQQIANCLYDGKDFGSALKPAGNKVWMLASVDGDGNTIMGIPMAQGGPFASFNANFNFSFTAPLTFTSGTVCAPSALPNPFSFNAVTGVAGGSVNTSNSQTISGLGNGVSAPISVSGGSYSKNGGAFTTTNGTVVDNDTVQVQQTASANEDGTTTTTNLNISGVVGAYNVTTVDKKPNAISFTTQTGVATGATVVSNSQPIGGMSSNVTTPISITGGEYSKDGGTTWTNVAGTVTNGDTVMVRQTASSNGATTTIATLTLGSSGNGTLVTGTFTVTTVGGVVSTGNNFTMLDPSGGQVGGTNDVAMTWDQQFNTSTSDPVTPATAHMHLSSDTPFFGYKWTAHHIRVFGPGTYIINVDCTTNQLETGTCGPNSNPAKNYTFTVGPNQIGAHMLFDWNTSTNIDVVDVWNQNVVFSPSQLYTGSSGFNAPSTVWNLMSSDWDGDGQNGAAMIDGPFTGFKANFNINYSGTTAATNYTPTVKVTDPSNAPGCSISPTPVSAVKRADWWLVAGFLAWLGGIRFRLKRKTRS